MPRTPAPEDVPRAFIEAWNRHDMPALAGLFAEKAHFVNVVGLWWKSRDEIEAAHAATHATIFRESRLTGEVGAVTPLAPGLAAVHLVWEMTGQAGTDGAPAGPRRGILLFVLKEEGNRWQVAVAQNTDIVPGVLAPEARP
ncbi:SgcJ/EcaC family oxidoreductase [Microvirga thermotolerans]|uniref:SgcJ/EcaC family oxidoreductase n=1 Tax=Microvirga thermotolerans TaxID=2651334 RepID=A0A5P9JVA9_9HYPH|nr:SgcJ/EcaC family oxidoreductase [Microvirga thermotolerans]QFU16041.1 SgcJ/EcaC family oxidoreductase [Microvirga thermotolerans]